MRNAVLAAAVLVTGLAAADPPDINGTWQLDQAHAGKSKLTSLTIHQTADSVQVSESLGPKKLELTCTLGGQECKIKEAGEAVSFWYNDAVLVMTEMRHGTDVVIKTRLQPADDGKTLHMQVLHIAPPGQKDESYTLTRVP